MVLGSIPKLIILFSKEFAENCTALLLAIAPFFLKSAFAIKFLITVAEKLGPQLV